MEININDFSKYIFFEILKIEAKQKILEAAINAIVNKDKPEIYDRWIKSQKELELSYLEELLLNHPFLKDDFDELLDELKQQ
jgi:hypothetical protein